MGRDAPPTAGRVWIQGLIHRRLLCVVNQIAHHLDSMMIPDKKYSSTSVDECWPQIQGVYPKRFDWILVQIHNLRRQIKIINILSTCICCIVSVYQYRDLGEGLITYI